MLDWRFVSSLTTYRVSLPFLSGTGRPVVGMPTPFLSKVAAALDVRLHVGNLD